MSAMSYAIAGAGLLDQHRPGWYNQIDLNKLDQSSAYVCVLGQLYGEYYKGLDALGIEDMQDRCNYGYSSNDDYDNLTEAWKKIILSRRGSTTTSYDYTTAQAIAMGRQIMERRDTETLIGLLTKVSGGDPELFRAALGPLAAWEHELLYG